MRTVLVESDGNIFRVELVRRGNNNSRVRFQDEHEELLSNELIDFNSVEEVKQDTLDGDRVIPITPLRRIYTSQRKFRGSRCERFSELAGLLHCGADRLLLPGQFLRILFDRSVKHFSAYKNADEPFVVPGVRQETHREAFARDLVYAVAENNVAFSRPADEETYKFSYVQHELNPCRTTRSVYEDGKIGRRSGGGGIDLLLRSLDNGLPIVGEIKADTETVGPTFALVQALTYAAELVTESQWKRLKKHAIDELGSERKVAIYLIFQSVDDTCEDYKFVQKIAEEFMRIPGSIEKIVGLTATLNDGTASFGIEFDYPSN